MKPNARPALAIVLVLLATFAAGGTLASELCARPAAACCPLASLGGQGGGASCGLLGTEISREPSCCASPAPPATPAPAPSAVSPTASIELEPRAEGVVVDTAVDLRYRSLGELVTRTRAAARHQDGVAALLSIFLI